MTAQIERDPRQGVELEHPWTWRDYVALTLSYVLIAEVFAALFFPDPLTLGLLTFTAACICIAGFVIDAVDAPAGVDSRA